MPASEPRWAADSVVGRVRESNEDSYCAKPGLFVLADGMGGHVAGEIASALAVAEFRRALSTEPATLESVSAAVGAAHNRILAEASAQPALTGMGTTLTALLALGDDQWTAVNIGDSRLYRFGDGRLEQLSVDHSGVQELVDAGQLTVEQARVHPLRHVVTRSLGSRERPRPDVRRLPRQPGQRFLLCSDGLTDELEDGDIAAVLRDASDPAAACTRLIAAAEAAGGRDNITVIVVDS
jgi:protein phosphatase